MAGQPLAGRIGTQFCVCYRCVTGCCIGAALQPVTQTHAGCRHQKRQTHAGCRHQKRQKHAGCRHQKRQTRRLHVPAEADTPAACTGRGRHADCRHQKRQTRRLHVPAEADTLAAGTNTGSNYIVQLRGRSETNYLPSEKF